jgi:hypothetical protein
MTMTDGLLAMLGLALLIFGIADIWRYPSHRALLQVRLAIVLGAVLLGWSVAAPVFHLTRH